MNLPALANPWLRRGLIAAGLLAVLVVFHVRVSAETLLLGWLARFLNVPPATAIGWAVDLVGFGFTLVVGLVLIAQFALPVQTWDERVQAVSRIFDFAFGDKGPVVFVKEGKMIASKAELKRGGAGVVLVDSSSAVVLEKGNKFSRAAGPGIVFLHRGERILTTLDLRRQSRSQPVSALTKDGIEVKTTIGVAFGLASAGGQEADDAGEALSRAGRTTRVSRRKRPYAFDAKSAFQAIYGAAVGKDAPVGWTDLPVYVTAERFRALLARHTLDDLFRPLDPKTFPLQEFGKRLTEEVRGATILRERGIQIYGASAGAFELPHEVQKQRVASWESEWNRRAQVALAAGEVEGEKIKQRARYQAQIEVTSVLRAALKPEGESWTPEDKERTARRIMGALNQLTSSSRRGYAGDALRILADLGSLLDLPSRSAELRLGEGALESVPRLPEQAGGASETPPEAAPAAAVTGEAEP